ncbi:MAG: DsbA family protein [Candidatus Paracaedibacteraceae bacterium]|nr:DsbA family protein [Candidatus Paracaedibacteraceae bacterium]
MSSWREAVQFLRPLIFLITMGIAQSQPVVDSAVSTVSLPEVGFGDRTAPVKVVMYHSLTCHHCAEFKLDKFPEFKQKYVDTGKVYFILKDFPTDEFSLKLSIICWAGRNVDKYLERSHLIIQNFNPDKNKKVAFDWVNADKPTEVIEELLRSTGITSEMIQPLLDDRSIEDAILQDALTIGHELGLNFAPGFTVNGKLVEMNDLNKAVDKAIKAADKPAPQSSVRTTS